MTLTYWILNIDRHLKLVWQGFGCVFTILPFIITDVKCTMLGESVQKNTHQEASNKCILINTVFVHFAK